MKAGTAAAVAASKSNNNTRKQEKVIKRTGSGYGKCNRDFFLPLFFRYKSRQDVTNSP